MGVTEDGEVKSTVMGHLINAEGERREEATGSVSWVDGGHIHWDQKTPEEERGVERSFEYVEFEHLWVLGGLQDLLFILLGLIIE